MNKNILLIGVLILNGINASATHEPKKPKFTHYHAEENPMRHLEGAPKEQDDVETIFTKLEGDYAKIDVKSSNQAIGALQGDSIDKADEMAEKMEKALGNYNPPALVQLALYFKEEGQTQKAYRIFSLAYMRAKIDVQASNDRSTGDIRLILLSTFAQHTLYTELSPAAESTIKGFQAYLKANGLKIVQLDRATPRNYDTRWPLLQGMAKYTQAPMNIEEGDAYEAIVTATHEMILQDLI